MTVRRNHGTSLNGLKNISELASSSGVAETTTTLITLDDGAVMDEWRNAGVPVHQIKGDGRLWFNILSSAPASPVTGDVWLEDTISGVVLRIQTDSGLTTIPAGDGSLSVTAASALLQGHAVRTTASGLEYAAADVASDQYQVIGLIAEDTLATEEGVVLKPGQQLELSDWTLLTGAATLTPGATYWLTATPGRYSAAAPDLEVVTAASKVGIAATDTILLIQTDLKVLA
jgi:hypothetical protein